MAKQKVFITSVAEQVDFPATVFVDEKGILNYHETEYPIINVIANRAEKGNKLLVVIMKTKGPIFNKNYRILINGLDKVCEEKEISYSTCLIEQEIQENREEHEKALTSLINAVPKNSVLYADITYGTNLAPSIIKSALNYIYYFKADIEVEDMVYGKFVWGKDEFGKSKIDNAFILNDEGWLFYMNIIIGRIAHSKYPTEEKRNLADAILFSDKGNLQAIS